MKRILITTFIALIAFSSFSQKNDKSLEKIESAKIALITQRLDLTPEQAEKFWPVYNEYAQKLRENRQAFDEAKRNYQPDNASEEENQRLLQLGMKTKEQALQLEKNYSERLLKVINTRQLMSLRKAENDFKAMILKRVQEQRQKRQQMQNNRQQNGQQLNRRRNN